MHMVAVTSLNGAVSESGMARHQQIRMCSLDSILAAKTGAFQHQDASAARDIALIRMPRLRDSWRRLLNLLMPWRQPLPKSATLAGTTTLHADLRQQQALELGLDDSQCAWVIGARGRSWTEVRSGYTFFRHALGQGRAQTLALGDRVRQDTGCAPQAGYGV